MRFFLLLASILLVIVSGCASTGSDSAFNRNYFPKHQYFVGGGCLIEYRSFENGTLIFADRNSKTIIGTKSMARNDDLDLSIEDLYDEPMVRSLNKIGLDPSKVKLSLYFIPYDGDDDTKDDGVK